MSTTTYTCSACAASMAMKKTRCETCGNLRLDLIKSKSNFFIYLIVAVFVLGYTLHRIYSALPMFGPRTGPPPNAGGAYEYSLRPEVFYSTHRAFIGVGILLLTVAVYYFIQTSRKMGSIKWW